MRPSLHQAVSACFKKARFYWAFRLFRSAGTCSTGLWDGAQMVPGADMSFSSTQARGTRRDRLHRRSRRIAAVCRLEGVIFHRWGDLGVGAPFIGLPLAPVVGYSSPARRTDLRVTRKIATITSPMLAKISGGPQVNLVTKAPSRPKASAAAPR